MRAYVGVTDIGWYRYLLATGPVHDEVNFWFPSATTGFAALSAGEPFLFKTHIDRSNDDVSDSVVGVGRFSGFARASIRSAWEQFGHGNGVASEEELRSRIAHYRKVPIGKYEDPLIGCVMLHDVVMFAPADTLPRPDGFASNLVRGKVYRDSDAGMTSIVEVMLKHQMLTQGIDLGPTQGAPIEVIPRIGQQAFKLVISEKYGHHCAITGEKVRPVLEAAHIQSVSAGGQHRVDNGLLLRSDVHTLYDRGYIGVDTKYRLRVSPALREEFGNGDWFYAREGEQITVPHKRIDRPKAEFLEWHNDEVFRV
ncbi:HNH endonuclease [Gordonia sp. PDNC005]|uniref:HNH endonuclease n=1 Tax=Gordonia sp. PDNC005 TaxID=2811424 RepID=UPI0019658B14|nr:HNH endonuclease [Gordonia sp. PDNC005]QRY63414.1 HNH endonuclease [Gordonia sp. PDNC005]